MNFQCFLPTEHSVSDNKALVVEASYLSHGYSFSEHPFIHFTLCLKPRDLHPFADLSLAYTAAAFSEDATLIQDIFCAKGQQATACEACQLAAYFCI